MQSSLNGVKLLGPQPTASKGAGWIEIVKDERLLIRHVALIQNSMRCAKVIPTWSNFYAMNYRREADRYLDSRAWKKFRSWWDLIYDIGDIDRSANKAKLGYAWAFLVTEHMARKHNKPRGLSEAKFGISAEQAGKLREAVLASYEALTLC